MSTTQNFTVYKGLPYQIRARAAGKWDYTDTQTFTTDGQTVSATMTNYNGLDADYAESVQSADTIDFTDTVLPWAYEYSTSLDIKKYCLMPVGTTYENITIPETANFEEIGTLTFAGKVVSGFSSSNFIRLPEAFKPGNKSWEFGTKVTTGSSVTNNEIFSACQSITDESKSKGIDFGLGGGGLLYYNISTNGTSWDFYESSIMTMYEYRDYWLKFGWDGEKYYVKYSQDGQNWTISSRNSTSPVTDTIAYEHLGTFYGTGGFGYIWSGSIDLSETYINIDNETWWTPYSGGGTQSLPGCTQDFTDDGSSTTLNCFVLNGDESIILTPNNSVTNGWLLGTVNIPAHTVYTYDNGTWTPVE